MLYSEARSKLMLFLLTLLFPHILPSIVYSEVIDSSLWPNYSWLDIQSNFLPEK